MKKKTHNRGRVLGFVNPTVRSIIPKAYKLRVTKDKMNYLHKNIALALILGFVGCQQLVNITLDNSDTTNPIFGIESGSVFGGKGVEIPNFSVISWSPDGKTPEAMWRIQSATGKRIYVQHIVYGVVPEGFKEAVIPKPLQPNHPYEALTMEPGFVGSLGFTVTVK